MQFSSQQPISMARKAHSSNEGIRTDPSSATSGCGGTHTALLISTGAVMPTPTQLCSHAAGETPLNSHTLAETQLRSNTLNKSLESIQIYEE